MTPDSEPISSRDPDKGTGASPSSIDENTKDPKEEMKETPPEPYFDEKAEKDSV